MNVLETEQKHVLIEKEDAIQMGLLDTIDKNYCKYKFCKHAEKNKKQKCREKGAGNTQAGRSRATCFCTHPSCMCGYHPTCYAFAHGVMQ